MSNQIIKHFDDLFYTVVATPDDGRVNFVIFEIDSLCDNGIRTYESEDGGLNEDVNIASPFAHGYVKWDGCSNWHFDEQDRAMIHQCSRQQLLNMGEILAACWDIADELDD